MEDTVIVEKEEVKEPWYHNYGRKMTSGTFAFIGAKLGESAYDTVLRAYRARKSAS